MRAALVAIAVAGCTTTGGGDDQQICADPEVAISLRDPSTGVCEAFDTSTCRGIPFPDWASCGGTCDSLGESDCLATAHCRAVYTGHVCPPGGCTDAPDLTFFGCWGTAPSSSLGGQNCWNLDPDQCAEDDECAAVFQATPSAPPLAWETCMPEAGP
jgi:hypothetical protein